MNKLYITIEGEENGMSDGEMDRIIVTGDENGLGVMKSLLVEYAHVWARDMDLTLEDHDGQL